MGRGHWTEESIVVFLRPLHNGQDSPIITIIILLHDIQGYFSECVCYRIKIKKLLSE